MPPAFLGPISEIAPRASEYGADVPKYGGLGYLGVARPNCELVRPPVELPS